MRALILCLVSLFLVSCAATGPKFSEIPAASVSPEKSRVYVYRQNVSYLSGLVTPIFDNGSKMGELNIGGYITYETDPGEHTISTNANLFGNKDASALMKAGETYYFMVTSKLRGHNSSGFFGNFTVIDASGRGVPLGMYEMRNQTK